MTCLRPSVLIAAAKSWPLSARLAIALLRHGCRVSVLCPTGHLLTHVPGVERIYLYSGLWSLTSLRRAMIECRPDIVVPCDDGVVAQLHVLHRQHTSLRDLIEYSLGAPQSYSIVSSRPRLLSTAVELGIRVARTSKAETTEDVLAWYKRVASAGVLKVDGESGGNGVRIFHSLDELLAAWRELSTRPSHATAWKRLAINRDPLALWMSRNQAQRDVIIQEFIAGRPANSMFACRQGEVLSLVAVVVVAAEGPTGAATVIRRVKDERMAQAAELLARRLQLSGFYGLDYMIDDATGTPHLIEMNPRCTQLGHLEFPDQGSLAGVFSAALRNEPRPQPVNPIRADTIALFPQALASGETCKRYIDSSYHDVPWDESELVRELQLNYWPLRQWPARLYHAVKPIGRPVAVDFENIRPAVTGTARLSDNCERVVQLPKRPRWNRP
jgi:carbamoylphosphate synthase large subunit